MERNHGETPNNRFVTQLAESRLLSGKMWVRLPPSLPNNASVTQLRRDKPFKLTDVGSNPTGGTKHCVTSSMVEPYVANVVIRVRVSGDAPNNISSVGLQALVFETGCGWLDSTTGYQTIVGWLRGLRLLVAN